MDRESHLNTGFRHSLRATLATLLLSTIAFTQGQGTFIPIPPEAVSTISEIFSQTGANDLAAALNIGDAPGGALLGFGKLPEDHQGAMFLAPNDWSQDAVVIVAPVGSDPITMMAVAAHEWGHKTLGHQVIPKNSSDAQLQAKACQEQAAHCRALGWMASFALGHETPVIPCGLRNQAWSDLSIAAVQCSHGFSNGSTVHPLPAPAASCPGLDIPTIPCVP